MRVISNKALKLFAAAHPQADKPLQDWRRTMENFQFATYAELKQKFNSVDRVGEYYVFDISGNRYRLIAAIHFNAQIAYVRNVLTHSEYNHWRP